MILSAKPIYSFLDLITFGQGLNRTIDGMAVKLPARYITESSSDIEKENITFLRSHCGEGATILDIGAHIGLFAVMAARIAGEYGKIFSFEPSTSSFEALQQTIRINQLDQMINPVNQAMGKERGQGVVLESTGRKKADKLHRLGVDVNTIDNFVMTKKLSKINFINIDVEGMEYDIVLGGLQVFKKYKPHIMIVIHPSLIEAKGLNPGDMYDMLDQLHYNILYKGNYISREQFVSSRKDMNLHLIPL